MGLRFDAVVDGPDHKIQLIAEIKTKQGATKEWAAQMRRNLIVHGAIPAVPFFLLALPDHFYLWHDGSNNADVMKLPDYVVETEQLLSPYLKNSSLSLKDLSEYGFEFLVIAWLRDLVNASLAEDKPAPEQKWLFDSGLYWAVKDGSVITETAA